MPFIHIPVFVELFGTKNKDGFSVVKIIFDDRKGGESFAQTYGIGENGAVEGVKKSV